MCRFNKSSRSLIYIILLLCLTSCVHYGLDQKEGFLKLAKCNSNCDYANSIKKKFIGKWMVRSKLSFSGVEYDPSSVGVAWEFREDGLVYFALGDKRVINGYYKIIDDQYLERSRNRFRYEITPTNFKLISQN